jgi:hypothetical protein
VEREMKDISQNHLRYTRNGNPDPNIDFNKQINKTHLFNCLPTERIAYALLPFEIGASSFKRTKCTAQLNEIDASGTVKYVT